MHSSKKKSRTEYTGYRGVGDFYDPAIRSMSFQNQKKFRTEYTEITERTQRNVLGTP